MQSKKWLNVGFIMILAFTFLIAGCSSNNNTQSGGNSSSSEEPKEGGTLVIARKADATNLDPHMITSIPTANYIFQKVYEGLVRQDENMQIQPLLAKEWSVSEDGLTWEFKLQEGVSFQDGAPFNADAVKKTMDRVKDANLGLPNTSKFAMVKEVKVVDSTTVQFILEYPYAPLLSTLSANEGSIISPKAIDAGPESLAKNPVGTGPFTFASWKPGQEMVLVKNENYWGQKAKIDKVVYKVVPEDATRIAMVETGEANIADNVPVTDIERIEASSNMKLVRAQGLGVEYLGFNTQKKPFDDVRVRQAIAYAIERDAILSGVYNNVGSRTASAMSPKVFGYNPNLNDYEYDINKAKELLKEAGYPNGFTMTITTDDRKERVNLAEVVQAQLKGIGIDVKLNVMEFGAYLEATDKGEHDMFIGGWGNATGDGDYNQYNVFHSSSHGAKGNQAFYANPEVDKLIEIARKETDSEKRKEIYAQLQEIELQDAPLIPIRTLEYVVVTSDNVRDFWLNPINYLMIENVSLQ